MGMFTSPGMPVHHRRILRSIQARQDVRFAVAQANIGFIGALPDDRLLHAAHVGVAAHG